MIDTSLVCNSGGIAIIQARNGSTRLPGKTMMGLGNSSILSHVVNRLSASRYISNSIIVATTNNPHDDVIQSHCKEIGVPVFRGHPLDVFSRFLSIYNKIHPRYIVRITGDCPFINANIVDKAIDLYLSSEGDYVSNTLVRSYPKGFDVECFTGSLLHYGNIDSLSREHVTPFIYNNRRFISNALISPIDHSHLRCTIDNQADYKFLSHLFAYAMKTKAISNDFFQLTPSELNSCLEKNHELAILHSKTIDKASCYDNSNFVK